MKQGKRFLLGEALEEVRILEIERFLTNLVVSIAVLERKGIEPPYLEIVLPKGMYKHLPTDLGKYISIRG